MKYLILSMFVASILSCSSTENCEELTLSNRLGVIVQQEICLPDSSILTVNSVEVENCGINEFCQIPRWLISHISIENTENISMDFIVGSRYNSFISIGDEYQVRIASYIYDGDENTVDFNTFDDAKVEVILELETK